LSVVTMIVSTCFIAETTVGVTFYKPFNDALDDLRVSGSVLLHERYSPPWAIDIPDERVLRSALGAAPGVRVVPFHLVRHGSFDLRLSDGLPRKVDVHEVAICPNGSAHRMQSDERAAPIALTEVLANRGPPSEPDDPTATELICGVFQLSSGPLNPLLSALPDVLKVKTAGPDVGPLLDHATAMLGIEVAKGQSSFVGSRILEVLFAEAVRTYGESEGATVSGWFRALGDSRIGRALSQLHERPGTPWTVAMLAETIPMSPSRFAARFREVTGQTVMAYAAGWRMTIACRRLRESDACLADVACAAGYRDTASFSRAFKALVGQSPAAWRSAQRRR